MPDSKITALASIGTGTDPANDPLVIVDVSDPTMAGSGTTKKVTLNQLLGAGGAASFSSLTKPSAATRRLVTRRPTPRRSTASSPLARASSRPPSAPLPAITLR
jgi:hypothetical protein